MQVSFATLIAELANANHEHKCYPSLKYNSKLFLEKKTTAFLYVSQLLQMIVWLYVCFPKTTEISNRMNWINSIKHLSIV